MHHSVISIIVTVNNVLLPEKKKKENQEKWLAIMQETNEAFLVSVTQRQL